MKKLLSKKIVACICLVLTVFAVSTSVLATTSVAVWEVSETTNSLYLRENVETQYSVLDGPFSDEISTYQMYSAVNGYANYFVFVKCLNGATVSHLQLYNTGYGIVYKLVDIYGNFLEDDDYRAVSIFHSSSYNGWGLTSYTSSGDYSKLICYQTFYNNTELTILDLDGSVLFEGSYTKDITEKKIIYEITYDEDNKKAQINASIKNAAEGDTLYYSTLGFKLNGKLLNPHEIVQNDISYIPVSENGLIHLQALDAERQYYRYSWY